MALNMTLYQNKINAYKMNEIMSATADELVFILFDQAILGCKSQNQKKASDAVGELISSLNFEYEISNGLFRLYDYSLRKIKQQQYNDVLPLLTELRDTWKEALHSLQAA